MKILQSGLLIFMLSLFGLQATAGPVDPASVTTFASGNALLSAEVNTTINALITAINDNATRVAALEVAASGPPDLAGRQYCVSELDSGFWVDSSAPTVAPDPPTEIGVVRGAFKAGMVLVADGTGTMTVYQDDFKEAFPNAAVLDTSGPLVSDPLTWTVVGNFLTLTFGPGEVEKLTVVNSGEIIIGGASSANASGAGIWYRANLIVLVEVADATTCPLSFGL